MDETAAPLPELDIEPSSTPDGYLTLHLNRAGATRLSDALCILLEGDETETMTMFYAWPKQAYWLHVIMHADRAIED